MSPPGYIRDVFQRLFIGVPAIGDRVDRPALALIVSNDRGPVATVVPAIGEEKPHIVRCIAESLQLLEALP